MANNKTIAGHSALTATPAPYGPLIMFESDSHAQFPMNVSKDWYELLTLVLMTHSSK